MFVSLSGYLAQFVPAIVLERVVHLHMAVDAFPDWLSRKAAPRVGVWCLRVLLVLLLLM